MSTPGGLAAGDAKNVDRRISLGKYVKRMSSVFKRDKTSRNSPAAPTAPSTAEAQPQATKKEQPIEVEAAPAVAAVAATAAEPVVSNPAATTEPTEPPAPTPPATQPLGRHAMQQERARALFAKYGLSLDSHDWIPAPAPMPAVQRVEKSIRMRVHRSCHHCGRMYGSEKVCVQCEHKRCKKCPRYPKKKSSADKDKDKDKDVAIDPKLRKKKVLTITTRSGHELAYQPTKQRVRRTCHRCETMFVTPSATVCQQCRHVRCTRCPREPAKLQKWPVGYPGDVESDSDSEVEKQLEKFRRTWRKPRQRVRWECEQCHAAFLHASPQCPGCGHERCDKCTRFPVKKTRKEETFDPKLVAAVEAKLRALDVDSDALTSEREAS